MRCWNFSEEIEICWWRVEVSVLQSNWVIVVEVLAVCYLWSRRCRRVWRLWICRGPESHPKGSTNSLHLLLGIDSSAKGWKFWIYPKTASKLMTSRWAYVRTRDLCCGAWWLIGRFDTLRPKGRGFESCSGRHVETLGKTFTRSCLRCFVMKLSIHAVSGAPLSSSGLEEVL